MRYWLALGLMVLSMSTASAQSPALPAAASPSPASAASPTLRIGVLPYLSPRTLLLEFAPLREFLEGELRRKTEILSAPDFPRFLARTDAGHFDLVVTAPHFARLAQQELGFKPLIAIRADFYALVLVPEGAAASTLSGLRGKTLHLPHRLSFISLQIEDFLRQRGILPERDLTVIHHSTDNNAILAAERSRDDAAAAQRAVFDGMPKEITDKLRILGSTQSALSLVALAHPRLSDAEVARLQQALNKFPFSVDGLKFFQSSRTEFIPADTATMRRLDAYLPRLKELLANDS
ncbi:MAG TPA: PhnD/SsuA/transferrin family substrate-binding protein [Paucimonas sp.]|nr:PhnD/SsuA/transferrin family substrate-binding protein [Paucimonas sp.]